MQLSPFSLPAPLVLALSLVLLPGCGEDPGAEEAASGVQAVDVDRDPTLRGLVARLTEAGLDIGGKLPLDRSTDQKARLGRAAGLANELAGASLNSDFPIETQRRGLGGGALLLERFASPEKARSVHQQRVSRENRSPNPGSIVYLQRGDKLLTLRGSGAPAARPMPGLPPPRPTHPPDPALVEGVRRALERAEPE